MLNDEKIREDSENEDDECIVLVEPILFRLSEDDINKINEIMVDTDIKIAKWDEIEVKHYDLKVTNKVTIKIISYRKMNHLI